MDNASVGPTYISFITMHIHKKLKAFSMHFVLIAQHISRVFTSKTNYIKLREYFFPNKMLLRRKQQHLSWPNFENNVYKILFVIFVFIIVRKCHYLDAAVFFSYAFKVLYQLQQIMGFHFTIFDVNPQIVRFNVISFIMHWCAQ